MSKKLASDSLDLGLRISLSVSWLFVLNALSSRMVIDIFRYGFHYTQKFA